MLILTRRVGESVVIGEDVTVTVLGVKGNQVRMASMRRRPWRFTVKKSSSASRTARVPVIVRPRTSPAPPFRGRLCPSEAPLSIFFASQTPAHYDCAPRRDGRVVEGAPLLRV